ncbi:MAG: carbohydrate kinase family protein [Chloroflexota bacterium]|jgi:ribokinase
MQQRPIGVIGDLVWDVLVKPDTQLQLGGDTTGQILMTPGGSAANVATWIARLGSDVAFIGSVGRDISGDLLITDLQRERVVPHVVQLESYPTSTIVVMIEPTGQRSMITNQGADFYLVPAHLPGAVLDTVRHLHVTAWSLFSDPPQDAIVQAVRRAKAAGAMISFDPASYQMIESMGRDTFVALMDTMSIDMLFPNRDEARILTGESTPERMAAFFRQRWPSMQVILKLDAEGCMVIGPHTQQHVTTTTVSALDSTGAGDSFNAAFLHRYLRDGDAIASAQLANRLGSWVVQRFGARPAPDAAFEAIRANQ